MRTKKFYFTRIIFSENSDFECEFSRKNHFDTQRDNEIVVNCDRNDELNKTSKSMIIDSNENSDVFFVIDFIIITYQWIKSKSSSQRIFLHHENIISIISDQKSDQKFHYSIRNFRSNSNHLFSARILQNQIYFISNSIIFFLLLDSFNIQLESSETLRRFFDIETILLSWKSVRKHIHRFINSVSLFHFDDRLDIQSDSQHHLEFRNFQYSHCFNIEIIYLFGKHCEIISVFLSERPHFLISTIISISIRKIVEIFINFWYCNHSSHSKIFRYSIYLFNKSTFVFCLDVKFNIKSETSRIF